MSRVSLLIVALFTIIPAAASLALAQDIRLPPAIAHPQGTGSPPVTDGDDIQRQQALAANAQRQVEIKRDTEKMAELTQELKGFLAKNDLGMMPVDAIKKVEQIEKLAHSLKGKMKQSF